MAKAEGRNPNRILKLQRDLPNFFFTKNNGKIRILLYYKDLQMSYSVMRPFKKKKTVLNSRIISFGPESASMSKVYQDSRFRDSWYGVIIESVYVNHLFLMNQPLEVTPVGIIEKLSGR